MSINDNLANILREQRNFLLQFDYIYFNFEENIFKLCNYDCVIFVCLRYFCIFIWYSECLIKSWLILEINIKISTCNRSLKFIHLLAYNTKVLVNLLIDLFYKINLNMFAIQIEIWYFRQIFIIINSAAIVLHNKCSRIFIKNL